MDDREKDFFPHLPAVGGRRVETSLADLEYRARIRLQAEQGKPLPDNALIALLCDTVRLCREYADMMSDRRKFLVPVKKDYFNSKRKVKGGRLLKGYPKVVIHRHLKKKENNLEIGEGEKSLDL